MSIACDLVEKSISQNEWVSSNCEIDESVALPEKPSAFPFGVKDLSASRIAILCGTVSQPCSG